MNFKEISLSDKGRINKYLQLKYHSLSSYHFANIFMWRGLYKIFYVLIEGCLCIFFRDKIGCFAYLPPLGSRIKSAVIENSFKIMDAFNASRGLSRIENVEEHEIGFFKELGYVVGDKPGDYLCRRDDLAGLKGDRFKSKRAAYNFFLRHHEFSCEPFASKDKTAALRLYQEWAQQRRNVFSDAVYQGMLDDNFLCQRQALSHFKQLGLCGLKVKISGKLKAYTVGFRLNRDTFCVLFEITDLNIKGLAQYIFRAFSEKIDYKYLNIMDDSGLDNLRKVKLSYHPFKVINSYIISRKNA